MFTQLIPSEALGKLFAIASLPVWIDWSVIDPRYVPVVIFLIRTLNLSLSTLRLLSVVRGRRIAAWFLAATQSVLYIISIVGVIRFLQNPLAILAYAGGFATGIVVGMWVENRLAPGHNQLRITSTNYGTAIKDALHELGYGVTEVSAMGKDGTVSVLYCFAARRAIPALESTVLSIDPEAFMTTSNVRQIHRGWRL